MSNGQQTPQEKQQKIVITIPEKALEGKYTNSIAISSDKEVFGLDFYFIKFPPNGILLNRFILTPPHAKRLADLLQKKIQEYEGQYKMKLEPAKTIEPPIEGFAQKPLQ